MVAQTFDIIFSLFFYPLQESRIAGISSTGKHKILPNKNTIFICQIIETIILISSSPIYVPYSYWPLSCPGTGSYNAQWLYREAMHHQGYNWLLWQTSGYHSLQNKKILPLYLFRLPPVSYEVNAMLARGNCFTVTYHLC